MKNALFVIVLSLAATVASQDNRPKLTDAQLLARAHSRQALNEAADKLLKTPEYKTVMQAQKDNQAVEADCMKGVDAKKWRLGDDGVFVEIKAPEPAK